MAVSRTVGLFVLTAVAEIVGCYLPFLWLRRGHTAWLLLPAAVSLSFPDRWDVIGATVSAVGMAIIAFGPRG